MITTLAVIAQFYQLQETSVNKIQALRQAQLQLLQDPTYAAYQHPYFCSAILNRLMQRISILISVRLFLIDLLRGCPSTAKPGILAISRFFSLNRMTIRLKKPQNLSQSPDFSLRRLPEQQV